MAKSTAAAARIAGLPAFAVSRESVLSAIQTAARNAGKGLAGDASLIRLDVYDDLVSFTSAGNGCEVITSCSLGIGVVTGSIAVSAKLLAEIVQRLPEGDVSFQVTEKVPPGGDAPVQTLAVQCGKSRGHITCGDVAAVPVITDFTHTLSTVVTSSQLKSCLTSVSHAQGKTDVRTFLNGTFLEASGKELCFVATDGHRLAAHKMQIDPLETPASGILSRDATSMLLSALQDTHDPVEIQWSETHIRVLSMDGVFTMTTLGAFPDWRRVIPKPQAPFDLLISKAELLAALNRVSTCADHKLRTVRLNYRKDSEEVVIAAESTVGDMVDSVVVQTVSAPADGFEKFMKLDYLVDAIRELEGDEIRLTVDEKFDATMKVGPADKAARQLNLVMPVRP